MAVATSNVAKGLCLMAKVLKSGPKLSELDKETISIWETMMARFDVSDSDWNDAITEYMGTCAFFPAPSDIIKLADKYKHERAMIKAKAEWDSLMSCVDEDGTFCLAEPKDILDGVYVGNGKGNGLPALLVPSKEIHRADDTEPRRD